MEIICFIFKNVVLLHPVLGQCVVLNATRYLKRHFALVVELVDTRDLKSRGHYGLAGSSPARGTITTCGSSSVGRARPCQGRGREFESRFPLQRENS